MSKSAERYLISSVLRDRDMTTATARSVNASMFHGYQEEWEWIENYYMKYKRVPSKTAFRDHFPDFGIKQANDTAHYSDEVRKAHSRHMLTNTLSDCADLITDGDIEGAVQLVSIQAIKIAAAIGTANDHDIFSSFDDVYADVEQRVSRVEETGSSGIATGFTTFDERTGGAQPGDLGIVGARLGQGKSWTLQRMATTAVMNGYRVQFDALEQSRAQVSMRIHSFLSSQVGKNIFASSDLMRGENFDLNEYKQFLHELKKKIKGQLHVSDTTRGRVGLMTLASQIERNQPDIMFIDYLTLMDKKGGEWQDVAALSGGVKQIATEYHIPIWAAAQLNRSNGMGSGIKPPGPEALAQSDSIGQDADMVVTIKQTSSSTMTMRAAKLRNGAGDFIWYNHFNPNAGMFEEVTHDKFLAIQDKDADQD